MRYIWDIQNQKRNNKMYIIIRGKNFTDNHAVIGYAKTEQQCIDYLHDRGYKFNNKMLYFKNKDNYWAKIEEIPHILDVNLS
jgi:hypothetical protein